METIQRLRLAWPYLFSVEGENETRPFVGIVVICDSLKYCIPLTEIYRKEAVRMDEIT